MTWCLRRFFMGAFLLSVAFASCSGGSKTRASTYECCEDGLISVCSCPAGPSCDPGPHFRSIGGGACATDPELDAGPDLAEEPPDLAPAPSPDVGFDTTCSMRSR